MSCQLKTMKTRFYILVSSLILVSIEGFAHTHTNSTDMNHTNNTLQPTQESGVIITSTEKESYLSIDLNLTEFEALVAISIAGVVLITYILGWVLYKCTLVASEEAKEGIRDIEFKSKGIRDEIAKMLAWFGGLDDKMKDTHEDIEKLAEIMNVEPSKGLYRANNVQDRERFSHRRMAFRPVPQSDFKVSRF